MRFPLAYRESILTVVCDDGLRDAAFDALMEARFSIESKISEDPFFGITYDPYEASPGDDPIVRRMCEASRVAGVGPMAGVAGAVALHVAERLMSEGSSHAIVENGGDIAFFSPEPRLVGIFADHPVFRNLAFTMSSDRIVGMCSSSRTVGPSVSLGSSSISTVLSDDGLQQHQHGPVGRRRPGGLLRHRAGQPGEGRADPERRREDRRFHDRGHGLPGMLRGQGGDVREPS